MKIIISVLQYTQDLYKQKDKDVHRGWLKLNTSTNLVLTKT